MGLPKVAGVAAVLVSKRLLRPPCGRSSDVVIDCPNQPGGALPISPCSKSILLRIGGTGGVGSAHALVARTLRARRNKRPKFRNRIVTSGERAKKDAVLRRKFDNG